MRHRDEPYRTGRRARPSAWRAGRARAAAFLLAAAFPGACLRADAAEADGTRPESRELKALAERADAAIRAGGDSVGREYVNRLRSHHYPAWRRHFAGIGPRPAWPTVEEAAADIDGQVRLVEAAKTWPAPGEFAVPKVARPPTIDGKLDDDAWKQAAVWTERFAFNETVPGGPATTWRAAWDDRCLYFAFECADADIVAPARERDAAVYEDDCVEMFILPEPRFRTYWEIVVAPNGSLFDSVECKLADSWGADLDPRQDVRGLQHAATCRGTVNDSSDEDEGYSVEVAMPFDQLPGYARRAAGPGDRIHFMLVRIDRTHGRMQAYAFRPLQAWGHNIWNHAAMELKGPEADAAGPGAGGR